MVGLMESTNKTTVSSGYCSIEAGKKGRNLAQLLLFAMNKRLFLFYFEWFNRRRVAYCVYLENDTSTERVLSKIFH